MENKLLAGNVIGTFIIRGLGMLVSILMLPLYMNYFSDNAALGVWFTLLTVLNWILIFDLGIGNGLRNELTIALSEKNRVRAQELISSSYLMLGGTVVLMFLLFFVFSNYINWNLFFNISETVLNRDNLHNCIIILASGIFLSFFLRLINSILYALQWSAINNLLSLITNLLLLAYLLTAKPSIDIGGNFIRISMCYAVFCNIPLLVATAFVFGVKLQGLFPRIRYFTISCAKSVFSLGIIFFVLQILYMLISVTNEWFISKFYAPQYCVDYKVYYSLFSLIGSLYSLALTPLWSAITKAYAEKRYSWIVKLSKYLYLSFIVLVLVQLALCPFMQAIINVWLGKNAITVDAHKLMVFVLYSVSFIWIALQSTIVAGLGFLKTQLRCYLFAAAFKVAGIVVLSRFVDDWILVVAITVVALMPYCIIQPIELRKKLKSIAVC